MSEEDRDTDVTQPLEKLDPYERIKHESNYLRGTLREGLEDPITGGISEEDTKIIKFHGIYQQDDRDLRDERRRQKLEPAYEFMVRVRLPGGICTPEQWLKLDELAHAYANGTLRLTTRQTFQFHGILKRNLRSTLQGLDEALLDAIGACGDGNRGVMCSVNPHRSDAHAEVYEWSKRISEHLLPKSRAYHEIWLNGERVDGAHGGGGQKEGGGEGKGDEVEPLYGRTYLPRKFKIGLAIPPTNDVDVYSQDIGLVAILEDGALAGFNVLVGGGLGRSDNEPDTFPRLGDEIGFCRPDRVVDVVEKIVTVQRDYGNRVERKRARMKYTIEDRGLEWFKAEVERRLGWELEEVRPYAFDHNGDRYGWVEGHDGRWHYTLFVENGRVKDAGEQRTMTGLRELAGIHPGEFRVTGNQNLVIANVPAEERPTVEAVLEEHGLRDPSHYTPLRLSSMACVAMPTCGLAMAESERYLPDLLSKLEAVMEEAGVAEEPIIVRMTGCPNGCARPYLGEIGFTGRAPGKYDVYLGAGFRGDRLNKPFLTNVGEERILEELTPILHHYARDRAPDERFGDFVIRAEYVPEVKAGREFND